jgi:hypothetical protein
MELATSIPRSPAGILTTVKRVHRLAIKEFNVTDAELSGLIAKVQSGTRNHHYLNFEGDGRKNNPRLKEIIFTILREAQ